MSNYFEYEVSYFDEETDKIEILQGVTYAESTLEAVTNVLDFYGEDTIGKLTIIPWDTGSCLEISAETLETMRKEIF